MPTSLSSEGHGRSTGLVEVLDRVLDGRDDVSDAGEMEDVISAFEDARARLNVPQILHEDANKLKVAARFSRDRFLADRQRLYNQRQFTFPGEYPSRDVATSLNVLAPIGYVTTCLIIGRLWVKGTSNRARIGAFFAGRWEPSRFHLFCRSASEDARGRRSRSVNRRSASGTYPGAVPASRDLPGAR